jgi:hypothetical protein
MTTTDSKPSAAAQPFMEQRLDALDRALLGILPRSERLAFVGQVETRVRELTDGNTTAESIAASAMEPEVTSGAVSRRGAAATPKRRSGLALSSGILGIVALVMLFAMPITYLFVATIGEELGDFVGVTLLGIHVLTVAIGGLAALSLGIAGLIRLARRKGQLVGHGWAITGLCTAPLPTLIGGLLVLVTSLSLVAVQTVSVEPAKAPPQVAFSPANTPIPPTSYGSSAGIYYPAIPTMPPANNPLSLPVSAAPTFCAPGNDCPQSLPPSTRNLAPTVYAAPDEFQSVPTQPAHRQPGAPTAQLLQAAPAPSVAPPSPGVPAPLTAEPPSDAPAPFSAAPQSLR